MRNEFSNKLRRLESPLSDEADPRCGLWSTFYKNRELRLVVSNGMGWEHVSVSIYRARRKRDSELPTWDMMCHAKGLIWGDEEVAMQLHPKRSEYVSNAPVLHLWRPTQAEIPTPHPAMVGIPGVGDDAIVATVRQPDGRMAIAVKPEKAAEFKQALEAAMQSIDNYEASGDEITRYDAMD